MNNYSDPYNSDPYNTGAPYGGEPAPGEYSQSPQNPQSDYTPGEYTQPPQSDYTPGEYTQSDYNTPNDYTPYGNPASQPETTQQTNAWENWNTQPEQPPVYDSWAAPAEPPRQDSWDSWQGQAAQQQGGWEPYGNGWQNPVDHQYVYTPGYPSQQHAAPAQKPPRKKSRAPRYIALVLACGLAGFGGGMAATSLNPPAPGNETVVYKAPEGGNSAATEPTASGAASLVEVAAMAKQSVVSITTENVVMDFATGGRVESGAGSGVIISEDGTIVTNHHVVDGARNVKVVLEDGTEHEASVLGSDKSSDIAVLKINASGLTPAVLGDSDNLQVGEYCIAIGNPMGTLEGTVTDGIISALNRSVTIDGNSMNLLQMSAAVSPGNSGGGLFNSKGELIGVVNAKSAGQDAEGLGFAIPVNEAMKVAEELITSGVVTRPGIGVTVQYVVNESHAAEVGTPGTGLYIMSVNPGSTAEKAGVQAGDKVLEVDGSPIKSDSDLSSAIRAKNVGDKITLTLERDGQTIELEVSLGVLEQS